MSISPSHLNLMALLKPPLLSVGRSMTQPAQLTTMLQPESCFFFFVTRLTPPFSSAADPILRWGRIGTMLLAELAEELLLRR